VLRGLIHKLCQSEGELDAEKWLDEGGALIFVRDEGRVDHGAKSPTSRLATLSSPDLL